MTDYEKRAKREKLIHRFAAPLKKARKCLERAEGCAVSCCYKTPPYEANKSQFYDEIHNARMLIEKAVEVFSSETIEKAQNE